MAVDTENKFKKGKKYFCLIGDEYLMKVKYIGDYPQDLVYIVEDEHKRTQMVRSLFLTETEAYEEYYNIWRFRHSSCQGCKDLEIRINDKLIKQQTILNKLESWAKKRLFDGYKE